MEVVTRKGRDGSFEVTVDGKPIYSKLGGRGLPTSKDVEEIVKKVKAKLT